MQNGDLYNVAMWGELDRMCPYGRETATQLTRVELWTNKSRTRPRQWSAQRIRTSRVICRPLIWPYFVKPLCCVVSTPKGKTMSTKMASNGTDWRCILALLLSVWIVQTATYKLSQSDPDTIRINLGKWWLLSYILINENVALSLSITILHDPSVDNSSPHRTHISAPIFGTAFRRHFPLANWLISVVYIVVFFFLCFCSFSHSH